MTKSRRTLISPPTQSSLNLFVLGDLVLDHAIFVRRKEKDHQPVGNEKVSEVERRVTMAGGAANCARALASVGRGQVFLWGITGRSPWGDFSDILDRAQTYDGAVWSGRVQLRALHDQSTRMNTITRLIVIRDDSQDHDHRFDDTGEVRLTEVTQQTAKDEVRAADVEAGIHAVVVNDLDMGSITAKVMDDLSIFCKERRIPLFVDPKRTAPKYKHISATAILPNLREWCHLVGQGERDKHWRDKLRNNRGLQEIAEHSLEHLPQFEYHVIKCDRDGAVLIGPTSDTADGFAAVRIPPHPSLYRRDLPHQLGTGDVVTAVLALEFASLGLQSPSFDQFCSAYKIANRAVTAYRENPWHRMPTLQDIDRLDPESPPVQSSVSISAPRRYLPRELKLSLGDSKTSIPQLVSVDANYHSAVGDVVRFFRDDWSPETMKSAFLTAGGGSGKSQLCSGLGDIMADKDIGFVELKPKMLQNLKSVRDFREQLASLRKTSGHKHYLVVVDEVFAHAKHLLRKKTGVTLLQAAQEDGVRMLLVDADLEVHRKSLSSSQFETRIQFFRLPNISERLCDIPFVFAAGCAKTAKGAFQRIVCEEGALLGVIDALLSVQRSKRSARTVFGWGEAAGTLAMKKATDGEIRITKAVLPDHCKKFAHYSSTSGPWYVITP